MIIKRGEIHLAFTLSTTLCIAPQNLSIGVNVVYEGSPSRMRRVRLISLGMTILPKSSTLLTMPVAFLYFSPLQTSRRGRRLRRPARTSSVNAGRAVVGASPYNHFTNYDAIICKRGRNILADLLFASVVL